MRILITGSEGFIGKNLSATFALNSNYELMLYDKNNTLTQLKDMISMSDFVFHLAGINRPQNEEEFNEGNKELTELIVDMLTNRWNTTGIAVPVAISSSTQAELDNPYGISKRMAEEAVTRYGSETGAKTYIYRFPNVFGKWSRPNYNSAIATFCHNIARGLPITVNNRETAMRLVYIDDVVTELIRAMNGVANRTGKYCEVSVSHSTTLGRIVDIITSFPLSRENNFIPELADELTKKLYSTYLSFLPEDNFSYLLRMNVDNRGSFTEFVKTPDHGQVSVNISKPGITKGNHWHNTKTEKFLVVSGSGEINFRRIDSSETFTYHVSGDKLEVVDIPPGYTHNIINTGHDDMITIMWANELFDQEKPDTFFLEV